MGPLLRRLLLAALLQLAPAQVRAAPQPAARRALSRLAEVGRRAPQLKEPRGPARMGASPPGGASSAGPAAGPLPRPTPSHPVPWAQLGAEPPQCPVPARPGSAPTVPAPDLRPPAQGRPPRLGDSTLPAECARRVVGRGRSQVARRGQAPAPQPDVPDHQNKVVSWIDVYSRATCQPREVVVPLTTEFMGTVAKQLVPSCVTVHRCGGCCPDDGLECVPTGQHQVRMQILMIRYSSSQLGEMSLEEHNQCECRPKKRESPGKPDRVPTPHHRPQPRSVPGWDSVPRAPSPADITHPTPAPGPSAHAAPSAASALTPGPAVAAADAAASSVAKGGA